ncbi:PLDc_N domain-containing protein [Georgenia sp. 311]|uniref:PLDc_N domain-containing protein n=1 Tax=Georgenia wutianyii TaxID=2585135 RepID=A0ABX5VNB1_9MICO|nr:MULTISPECIES: PLD nuclease N-terminal domain-containing protein [Georgenia]QDB79996.1 PLDc_N domain-containing protein [Georgenia wutianyii]TNC19771.1 PLDc_N domain-containing protein [Georgenia sp. 311]
MPKQKQKQKKQWKDMSGPQRGVAIAMGSVQLALAVSAWADLATRPKAEVNGKKGIWALVIAVNWVGPVAYFVKGRKKS